MFVHKRNYSHLQYNNICAGYWTVCERMRALRFFFIWFWFAFRITSMFQKIYIRTFPECVHLMFGLTMKWLH